jgi:hypothetical protein
MRKIAALLLALASFFAAGVSLAATAAATHVLYIVHNEIPNTTFHARCLDAGSHLYIKTGIDYGENSADGEQGCNAFSVGDNRNVKYRSLASGAVYWSGCGRNLPHYNPTPAGAYGWAYVGNDVELIGKAAC